MVVQGLVFVPWRVEGVPGSCWGPVALGLELVHWCAEPDIRPSGGQAWLPGCLTHQEAGSKAEN